MSSVVGFTVTDKILLLEQNKADLNKIFNDDANNTAFRIQIARLVATFLMVVAVNLICSPIPALLEFIPFLNSVTNYAMTLFSLIIGIFLAFITIAVAHITQNPQYLLGVCIFLSIFFYIGASSDSDPDDAEYSYHVAYLFTAACILPIGYIIYNYLSKSKFERKLALKLDQLRDRIPLPVASATPSAPSVWSLATVEMPAIGKEVSEKQKLLVSGSHHHSRHEADRYV